VTATCYAQRLLNLFRGVMNIIEHEGAEAVTTDGLGVRCSSGLYTQRRTGAMPVSCSR